MADRDTDIPKMGENNRDINIPTPTDFLRNIYKEPEVNKNTTNKKVR